MNTPAGQAHEADRRRSYWRGARRVTAALLMAWFVFGLGIHYFARDLGFSFFGWPFSFWMAAQGSLLVFAGLIALYAWLMERLDRAHDLEEGAQ